MPDISSFHLYIKKILHKNARNILNKQYRELRLNNQHKSIRVRKYVESKHVIFKPVSFPENLM